MSGGLHVWWLARSRCVALLFSGRLFGCIGSNALLLLFVYLGILSQMCFVDVSLYAWYFFSLCCLAQTCLEISDKKIKFVFQWPAITKSFTMLACCKLYINICIVTLVLCVFFFLTSLVSCASKFCFS